MMSPTRVYQILGYTRTADYLPKSVSKMSKFRDFYSQDCSTRYARQERKNLRLFIVQVTLAAVGPDFDSDIGERRESVPY